LQQLPGILKTASSLQSRLVLALMDLTSWPNDASLLGGCLQAFTGILNMSPAHTAGFMLQPLAHAQTNPMIVLKNRRKLEDSCIAAQLDIMTQVYVSFVKDSRASSSDRRQNVQSALFLTSLACQNENPWCQGEVFRIQTLQSIPLIKVSDMLGYDSESRPSPSARVDQTLGYANPTHLFFELLPL